MLIGVEIGCKIHTVTDTHGIAATDPAESAIPRLFGAYGDRIFGLALKMCGTKEDAEDLVQETFLRAFRGWRSFKGLSAPSTWLFTIATRACKRQHRRKAGAPARLESFHDLLPSDEEGFLDVPAPDEGPLDAVLRQEATGAVESALATLPLPFRLALTLKDLGEFSLAEVAQILGIKEATVKTRVYRARLHLAKQLKARMPKKHTGPPDFELQVCFAMFWAKMDALDNGREFEMPHDHVCTRCQSMFSSLDISLDVCKDLTKGEIPPKIRRAVLAEFNSTTAT
jgi:RNA polymerase sigma-70 factor (ECF subfamily)